MASMASACTRYKLLKDQGMQAINGSCAGQPTGHEMCPLCLFFANKMSPGLGAAMYPPLSYDQLLVLLLPPVPEVIRPLQRLHCSTLPCFKLS